jgi:recombinational DNA repair protein RecR
MMTREDASEILSDEEISCLIGKFHGAKEALDLALSALRPVGREQVEKVWRGYWEHDEISSEKFKTGKFLLPTCSCSKCGAYVQQEANFCPVCGDAKTDEAVQMVMEKINNMEEMTNEH